MTPTQHPPLDAEDDVEAVDFPAGVQAEFRLDLTVSIPVTVADLELLSVKLEEALAEYAQEFLTEDEGFGVPADSIKLELVGVEEV